MYQFSLNWFLKLFVNALTKVDQVEDIESRIKLLNEFVTESVFKQVCGSLFEKHKLLFSFLLSIKILGDAIDLSEWKFLIRGHNPHQVSVNVGDLLDILLKILKKILLEIPLEILSQYCSCR
jgi:dynein heavy chain